MSNRGGISVMSAGTGYGWNAKKSGLNKAMENVKTDSKPAIKIHITALVLGFLFFAVSVASGGVMHQRSILNTANVTVASGNTTANVTISLDNVFTLTDAVPGISAVLAFIAGSILLSFHMWIIKHSTDHSSYKAISLNRSWLAPGVIFGFMGAVVICGSMGFWEIAIGFQFAATIICGWVMVNCGISSVTEWIEHKQWDWPVVLGNDAPQGILFAVNLHGVLMLCFLLGTRNQDAGFLLVQDYWGAGCIIAAFIAAPAVIWFFMLVPAFSAAVAIITFYLGVANYGVYIFSSSWSFVAAIVNTCLAFTTVFELISLPVKEKNGV